VSLSDRTPCTVFYSRRYSIARAIGPMLRPTSSLPGPASPCTESSTMQDTRSENTRRSGSGSGSGSGSVRARARGVCFPDRIYISYRYHMHITPMGYTRRPRNPLKLLTYLSTPVEKRPATSLTLLPTWRKVPPRCQPPTIIRNQRVFAGLYANNAAKTGYRVSPGLAAARSVSATATTSQNRFPTLPRLCRTTRTRLPLE
jgi:hypothetical protein